MQRKLKGVNWGGSLFFFFLLLGTVEGTFKRWLPNTNFENPQNWDKGRLPCETDKVKFPDSASPVFVQANATVVELVLPENGEIVLGDFSSISFSVSSSPSPTTSCPGEEITFNRTNAEPWLDPENWCVTGAMGGDCQASQPTLLPTEKVPCQYDGTAFPTASTFLVNISSDVDILMHSLTLSGQSYTTTSFKSYLESAEGKKQFVRDTGGSPTTINVRSNRDCTDQAGCACGNDQGKIKDKICAVQQPRCPDLMCRSAPQATGGCCGVCGAVLKLTFGTEFRISSIKGLVRSEIQSDAMYKNVTDITSRTTGDHIQIVLTDEGPGETASQVGKNIKKQLDDDIASGSRKYQVTSVSIQESQSLHPTPAPHVVLDGGSITGIIIAILIILGVIVLAIFCFTNRGRTLPSSSLSKIKLPRPNMPNFGAVKEKFKRFGSKDKGSDFELGSSVSWQYDDSIGFDNPLYDKQTKSSLPQGPAVEAPGAPKASYTAGAASIDFTEIQPESAGFSNPLYADIGDTVTTAPSGSDFREIKPDTAGDGFFNPLYSPGGTGKGFADPSLVRTDLRVNPVFSAEGVEEESDI